MQRRILLVLAATAASAQAQITMTQVGTAVDIQTTSQVGALEFIGQNPSAVAWNGSTLWVAGFNNSGTTGDVAIVRVDNAATVPSLSSAFAVRTGTVGSRGYTGLAIQGSRLAASYDNGSSDPNGIAVYDATTFVQSWAQAARGSSGVAFDPDFNAAGGPTGTGTGWATFSSGRRALNDTAAGTPIWTTSTGMIFDGGFGTLWRDITFDPSSGDVYLRMDNRLAKSTRSASNATLSAVSIGGLTVAGGNLGQNVGFLDTAFGDFVMVNDRQSGVLTQDFFTVVKAFDTNGNPATVTWPAGFTPPLGTGWYDFSYDAASDTVAILDFSARSIYLFAVSTNQSGTAYCIGDGSGTACPCANSGVAGNGCASSVNPSGANLAATGPTSLTNDLVILAGTGMPNSSALYFQGTSQQSGGLGVAFGDGLRCAGGSIVRLGTKANVGGSSQYPAAGDPSVSVRGLVTVPGTRAYQCWYRNAAAFCTSATFNLTNGYQLTWTP